ncbi:MAG: Periplasmic thiol:disulfide interchange protein DsbA [Labilithrix sp.]|nr:Periplasmic thiol:disulfide interchange protein DsbA [Labilithrix sp.]
MARLSFVLFLALAWLVACGGGPTAPKGPDNLVVGADKNGSQPIAASNEPVSEDDVAVPVGADDPVRGSRLAYVTIVVFSDFQCPFCGKLATTFERIAETYGEDVRFVFKHDPLPFHEHARLAADVGSAVFALKGSEAFWRYHDMAFRRQQLMSPDTIRTWAVAAGVDSREIEEGIAKKKFSDKVERDLATAKRLGVGGTPASFVNGVSLSGAQPFEKFKDVIDAELGKAKALAAQGVARDRIYGRMAAANYQEPKLAKHDDDDDDDDKPDTQVWKVPVGTSPVRGSSAALVTVVEFGDFQCPFCKRVQPTLERLRTEYGDRVRWVWKDRPLSFHKRAEPAAELARSARAQKGDAAFWTAHDKLFDSQAKLEDADLEAVARAMGLDVAKTSAAIKGNTFAKAIEADQSLGDDIEAAGTPHFFINGHRLVGAQPYEKLKAAIDTELTKAEGLVRSGVAKTAVYEAIIKDGKSAPEPDRKSVAASAVTAPFRGAANAKVVIQEFSDFQCPFCGRAEPTIDELLKAYPGKVKVVWRNMPLPFHTDAPLAAEAAREAFVQKGNDGFSKMRELLFKGQKAQDGLKRDALDGYAKTIGLDTQKFAKALDDRTHQAAVEADKKAANDAGINGTPAFTIGPYYLSGAQPLPKFKKLVDRVLTEPAQPVPPPSQAVAPAAAGAAVTLPGGLVVKDTTVGTGAAVKSGDTVTVHYVGTLTDGTEFDSSRKSGQPFSFGVGKGQVIKGWDQGLIGMKVGGRRKLTIPSDLAYGDRGMAGAIPPKSTLFFDIELLSIK